jgi:membrane protease YdiL (CAAX protease family)
MLDGPAFVTPQIFQPSGRQPLIAFGAFFLIICAVLAALYFLAPEPWLDFSLTLFWSVDVMYLGTMAVIWISIARHVPDGWGVLGFRGVTRNGVLGALAIVALMALLCYLLMYLPFSEAEIAEAEAYFAWDFSMRTPLAIFTYFLSVAVIAPIVEEVLFRSVLFGYLRSRAGFWIAAAASSAIFAVLHFYYLDFGLLGWAATAWIFILGVLLAALYERTGVLTHAVLVHAVWNAGVTCYYLIWV